MNNQKQNLGQFNTKSSVWLRPHVAQFIKNSGCTTVVDPYAGAGDLLSAVNDYFTWYIGYDIDLKKIINLEIIKYIIPALKATKNFEIKNIVLSTKNVFTTSKSSTGQFIVIPKNGWSDVHQFVRSSL